MICLKQLGDKLGRVILFMVCLGVMVVAAGCMTPSRADRETDEVAHRLATVFWQIQTGRTNDLDLTRPADALTLRVAVQAMARGEESVVFPAIPNITVNVTNGVWQLTLSEALTVAARNDHDYQRLKEAVFTAALELDSSQLLFETTFSSMVLGALTDSIPGSDPRIQAAADADFTRRFESGSIVAGQLAVDISRLLRSDWSSLGIVGDLSMTIPLLRGSGREIVREPLTQAERNVTYAIRTFEFYRQTYSVRVTDRYYGVLEYAQRLKNAQDNEHNLELNSQRASMMFEAGRMGSIEADQAKSQFLTARESVVALKRAYDAQLDLLKMAIGLPPEARVDVDSTELDTLTREIQDSAQAGTGGGRLFPDEEDACALALSKRLDIQTIRDTLEDAQREVQIAEDMLRADVTIVGNGTSARTVALGHSGDNGGGEGWRFFLRVDWPWNRRLERNAYKKKRIALEQTQRTIEAKEDGVKASIREGLRSLAAAESTYNIRVDTLRVAQMRVDSTALFMQSGRVIMRDVLDAQKSYLNALDNFCSAIIDWRMRELELRRDMGMLALSEAGVWQLNKIMDEGPHE